MNAVPPTKLSNWQGSKRWNGSRVQLLGDARKMTILTRVRVVLDALGIAGKDKPLIQQIT